MAKVTVKIARTFDDLMRVFNVRSLVYIGEQNCPYNEEFDGNDFTGSTHIIAYIQGEPVGVLRLRWFNGFAKFERAAVIKKYRKFNVIKKLAAFSFNYAAQRGYQKIIVHAQSQLARYWRRYGFVERSGRQPFSYSDYNYVEMETTLEASKNAIQINTDPMKINRPDGLWDEPGVLDRSIYRNVEPQNDDTTSQEAA